MRIVNVAEMNVRRVTLRRAEEFTTENDNDHKVTPPKLQDGSSQDMIVERTVISALYWPQLSPIVFLL